MFNWLKNTFIGIKWRWYLYMYYSRPKDYGWKNDDDKFTIEPIDEVDLDSLIDDNMNETFISSVDGSEISFQELMEIMRNRKSQ